MPLPAMIEPRKAVFELRCPTSKLPSAAHNQKPGDGRCRCSSAPVAAVASGSTPMITLACTACT